MYRGIYQHLPGWNLISQ